MTEQRTDRIWVPPECDPNCQDEQCPYMHTGYWQDVQIVSPQTTESAASYLKKFDPDCVCVPQGDGHVWICMEDRTPFDLTHLIEVITLGERGRCAAIVRAKKPDGPRQWWLRDELEALAKEIENG